VDLHLKGFTAMGAKIEKGHGFVEAVCPKLKGAKIYLDFPKISCYNDVSIERSDTT